MIKKKKRKQPKTNKKRPRQETMRIKQVPCSHTASYQSNWDTFWGQSCKETSKEILSKMETKRVRWRSQTYHTDSEVLMCRRKMSEEIIKRINKVFKLAKCMKHDTAGSSNARTGTHFQSLQATTIRVEASHKTQLCNNPPVLKYLWASAYNPPPLLYYLSAEMI